MTGPTTHDPFNGSCASVDEEVTDEVVKAAGSVVAIVFPAAFADAADAATDSRGCKQLYF